MAQKRRTAAPDIARRLALSYSALLHGLTYSGSEGDSPFLPFYLAYLSRRFDLEEFRHTTRMRPFWELSRDSGVTFLSSLSAAARQDEDDQGALAAATAYESLKLSMQATLGDLSHVTATARRDEMSTGWHPTRHYLLGQVSDGLAGLLIISIET